MKSLPYTIRDQIINLAKAGLTPTGQAFLTNFMLAEKAGHGFNNRAVLLTRIRMAPDAAKAAAMAVFDGFVNGEK